MYHVQNVLYVYTSTMTKTVTQISINKVTRFGSCHLLKNINLVYYKHLFFIILIKCKFF